jgi:hypothetical protein
MGIMSSLDRRLERAEQRAAYQMIAEVAARYDLTPEEVIEEARQFFALTEAEQDAKIQAMIDGAQAEGNQEEEEIFKNFRDSIQSYR